MEYNKKLLEYLDTIFHMKVLMQRKNFYLKNNKINTSF